MTDKMYCYPLRSMLQLILQSESAEECFAFPKQLIFSPKESDSFRMVRYGKLLETPLGVAAGPHTQMTQNIIAAWLCGARYIELKTVQTLDKITVSKPCIDIQDEGYNCEWSQELTIEESFNQYLNAWILIHILNHKLHNAKNNNELGTIFNMSVGYNMEGILKPNVQWFFDKMENCKAELEEKIQSIKDLYPEVEALNIPHRLSDNITLSTMHGCPADEIEKIGLYLIETKKLHTTIKLNPTLLGSEQVRNILNKISGFEKITVPDEAFGHDLKYPQALQIINSLADCSKRNNLDFSLKLTNTLEVVNHKNNFTDAMMYMSGRALHPISINLARKLQNDFGGQLDISYCAGADAFNTPDIIAGGLKPVTVCSDLLKPGGYMRMNQYITELNRRFAKANAENIEQFIVNQASTKDVKLAALENLNRYADNITEHAEYHKHGFTEPTIKTSRELGIFDCVSAPCVETCPTNQDIPAYMHFTANGETDKAFDIIKRTNSFPMVTGMVCDHLCQTRCTRINYDNSLMIRDIKRFVTENQKSKASKKARKRNFKVAVIGAGPSGLSCANYLALNGITVEVFESKEKAGGMVTSAIPSFRLTNKHIEQDIKRIEKLGVKIQYSQKIDSQRFDEIRNDFDAVYLACGAQKSAAMKLEGIDSEGVYEPLQFLFDVKALKLNDLGKNVVIIGGGNTAMDAARTAYRLVGNDGKVTLVYRRTIAEMPADLHEIEAVIREGVEILELTAPEKIVSENGKVKSLICSKMKLGTPDKSGRPTPVKIENSEFVIDCDSIIPAIGQELDIDFVDTKQLKTKPNSYETLLDKVFIGGDAFRGASTAINAVADGRKAAEEILKLNNFNIQKFDSQSLTVDYPTLNELKVKRAQRQYSVQIPENESTSRTFNLISRTYSETEAKTEAARCLYCDALCNVCVSVCPNVANFMYETTPKSYDVYTIKKVSDKTSNFSVTSEFTVNQRVQIVNLADWCNECGNCETFCPTKDAPYKTKPHIHLTKRSFEAAKTGYLLADTEDGKTLFYKSEQNRHILVAKENNYLYMTHDFLISLEKESLKPMEIRYFTADYDKEINLKTAIEMSVMLDGLHKLMLKLQ